MSNVTRDAQRGETQCVPTTAASQFSHPHARPRAISSVLELEKIRAPHHLPYAAGAFH